MKAYGGLDVQVHVFLTSAPVGGEWSASRLGRYTPGEITAVQLDRRLCGPRTSLDDVDYRY
jgi:hypothetical protein